MSGSEVTGSQVAERRALITVEQLQRRVPGGTGTYTRGLLRGLQQIGQPFDVFKAQGKVDLGLRETDSDADVRKLSSPLPVKFLTKWWDLGLSKKVNKNRHFVFHATSPASPKVMGVPQSVVIHDVAWREFPEAFGERGCSWHEAALQRAINNADVIFTPSPDAAAALESEGFPSGRIVQFTQGVDHLGAPDFDAMKQLLRTTGVAGDRFILSVGTLEPRKNLARLTESYEMAARESNVAPLVIAGPSGWGELQNKNAPNVYFVGAVSPAVLTALYASSEMFVSVPLMEGYGLPAVEAMSQGAPVISSRVPSVGNAAEIVNPFDVDEIAQAIANFTSSSGLRTTWSERGKAHTSTLSWKTMASQHVAAWNSLAK